MATQAVACRTIHALSCPTLLQMCSMETHTACLNDDGNLKACIGGRAVALSEAQDKTTASATLRTTTPAQASTELRPPLASIRAVRVHRTVSRHRDIDSEEEEELADIEQEGKRPPDELSILRAQNATLATRAQAADQLTRDVMEVLHAHNVRSAPV